MRLCDCKPYYLWLPLHKRSAGEREALAGELHLRLQWSSEELERPTDVHASLALEVQLAGIGLSIVEASVAKLPREAQSLCPV